LSSADTEKQEAEKPETTLENPESVVAEAAPQIAEQLPQLQDGMNPALRREITCRDRTPDIRTDDQNLRHELEPPVADGESGVG